MTVREFKKENNYCRKKDWYGMSQNRCTTCAWVRRIPIFKKHGDAEPWILPRDFCDCEGLHFMTDGVHWCDRFVWRYQTSNMFVWSTR